MGRSGLVMGGRLSCLKRTPDEGPRPRRRVTTGLRIHVNGFVVNEHVDVCSVCEWSRAMADPPVRDLADGRSRARAPSAELHPSVSRCRMYRRRVPGHGHLAKPGRAGSARVLPPSSSSWPARWPAWVRQARKEVPRFGRRRGRTHACRPLARRHRRRKPRCAPPPTPATKPVAMSSRSRVAPCAETLNPGLSLRHSHEQVHGGRYRMEFSRRIEAQDGDPPPQLRASSREEGWTPGWRRHSHLRQRAAG